MPQIVAAENPELANELVNQILAGLPPEEDPTPEIVTKPTTPSDTTVRLPGGYYTQNQELLMEAEVRELNGFDEEEMSKATSTVKRVKTLLERGVVSVGEIPANPKIFDRMLTCDRDTLLLAIRKVTYGSDVDFVDVRCPYCNHLGDLTVDLETDIPVRTLDDPNDRHFTVPLRKGSASVHLPDGFCQTAVLSAEDASQAELATIMLVNCVETVNEIPVVNEDSVRRLGVRDRAAIIQAIEERIPGPRFAEVMKACPQCEEKINIPINLLALFRI